MLTSIDMNVRICEKYGRGAALAVSLNLAATICSFYGDLDRCSIFWQWAAREWKMLEGEDSPRFIHSNIQALKPQRDRKARKVKKWVTQVGDVLRYLEDGGLDVFEEWLWQRTSGAEESKKLPQPEGCGPSEQEEVHVNKRRKKDKGSDIMKEQSSSATEDRNEQEASSSPRESHEFPS